MHYTSSSYFKIVMIAALVFVPAMAFADNGKASSTAVNIGWASIGCGLAANLALTSFKLARKMIPMKVLVGSGSSQNLASTYSKILNFHIILNSIGFLLGLFHGYLLLRGLDYISLSLVVVMTVSMLSGIILKYASGNNTKFFVRLVHSQFILGVMLVTLVLLHVITKWH
ncbi:MAG: hypothetical protein KGI28_03625 [Thaumarchaeota archaeon]|nr:hypothetical protein [Nitrososphaerota archaeon]